MEDSTVVDISSEESSSLLSSSSSDDDVSSEYSEYVPDGDSRVQVIFSSDDGEYESDECDGEVDEESGEEEKEEKARGGVETDETRHERVIKLLARGGDLNGLRLEECKAYLRKHGLRISGTKSVCIQRIHEHLKIKDGSGQKMYPESSFVINCKGDVCTGDTVLFKQKVYEKYNLASRGGAQTPIGMRIIAGKVVKESYGATKQQHTFTVEVLWTRGVKPLPPLYPLLIKGRNLYRMRISRQPWPNEVERQKVLAEKHARGTEARIAKAVARGKRGRQAKGLKAHKNAQNSNGFELPSKQHTCRRSETRPCKKAKFSMTLRQRKEKFKEENNGCSSSLAAPVGQIAVSDAPKAVINPTQNNNNGNACAMPRFPTQNNNTGNACAMPRFSREYADYHRDSFCKQEMEFPHRTQIIHQYPAREVHSMHNFHPAVSHPFGSNIRSLTSDPYMKKSSVWMPLNPVRNNHFLPSFHWNPRPEWAHRSGAVPLPQVHIDRAHLPVRSHVPPGMLSVQVPNSKPVGSFSCSFSGCHDLGARDCVNSACSKCCRKQGRRCNRHKIS